MKKENTKHQFFGLMCRCGRLWSFLGSLQSLGGCLWSFAGGLQWFVGGLWLLGGGLQMFSGGLRLFAGVLWSFAGGLWLLVLICGLMHLFGVAACFSNYPRGGAL